MSVMPFYMSLISFYIVTRMQSAVKYMMKTVWENFPVYYCCSGWMQSEGREECSTRK